MLQQHTNLIRSISASVPGTILVYYQSKHTFIDLSSNTTVNNILWIAKEKLHIPFSIRNLILVYNYKEKDWNLDNMCTLDQIGFTKIKVPLIFYIKQKYFSMIDNSQLVLQKKFFKSPFGQVRHYNINCFHLTKSDKIIPVHINEYDFLPQCKDCSW